ncbi:MULTISPECIES: DUF6274 family protein [unclassified Streptomyces]|uniref:DUF6274 family protein n=1 Tax=unclassified Streptomyces TaxID=2593676 RepID=UPI000DB98E92|nr:MULTISPECIES: DUF6274 family protein [unclassified Streptomyces]MYT73019.1 hypothetical protein [Streptomyces sp. SID8367]RAJ73815.1 hypothetical protein K377_06901 [Streptomyces sp. PsTaAH-137]
MAAGRHETRALLRAHLSAASGHRHLTRHCPVCHRLLRLAMDPSADAATDAPDPAMSAATEALEGRESAPEGGGDESPPKA